MIGNAGGLIIIGIRVIIVIGIRVIRVIGVYGWVRANHLPAFEPVYIVTAMSGRIGVIIQIIYIVSRILGRIGVIIQIIKIVSEISGRITEKIEPFRG